MNNPNCTEKKNTAKEFACSDLEQTNQMISWHRARWVVLFWQCETSKFLAGKANFIKSPSVYPVFGVFGGANPPLH